MRKLYHVSPISTTRLIQIPLKGDRLFQELSRLIKIPLKGDCLFQEFIPINKVLVYLVLVNLVSILQVPFFLICFTLRMESVKVRFESSRFRFTQSQSSWFPSCCWWHSPSQFTNLGQDPIMPGKEAGQFGKHSYMILLRQTCIIICLYLVRCQDLILVVVALLHAQTQGKILQNMITIDL